MKWYQYVFRQMVIQIGCKTKEFFGGQKSISSHKQNYSLIRLTLSYGSLMRVAGDSLEAATHFQEIANARGIAKLTAGEIFDATNNTDKKYPAAGKRFGTADNISQKQPAAGKRF